MSQPDSEYLDSHLTALRDKVAPATPEDVFFEQFCTQQILKARDLDLNDLESGFIGGGTIEGRDGGIDSAYFFCEGHLVREEMVAKDFESQSVNIQLVLIQAKRSQGYGEDAIAKFRNVADDLLDPDQDPDDHGSTYTFELISIIKRFRTWRRAFIANAQAIDVKVHFHYATKGTDVHPEVQKKATQLEERVSSLFPCQSKVFFVGAPRLLAMIRDRKGAKETLKFSKDLGSGVMGDAYICLTSIKDFVKFISDPESNEAKEYLLAPNVRNYLGGVDVNKQIRSTLGGPHDAEFWWLNNGVTIVGREVERKTDHFRITRPRIVNGLQTSREIFNYARENGSGVIDDPRHVMVRILQSKEEQLTNRIIKSTNSQTRIRPIYLFSTDEIHFNLEAAFPGLGLYYERVINQWVDQDKPSGQIVTFPYLSTAIMAMYLQAPHEARARPDSYAGKMYRKLFDSARRLSFYSNIAVLMKKVDAFLASKKPTIDKRRRRNLSYYLAMYACACLCKKSSPQANHIALINPEEATDTVLNECLKIVEREFGKLVKHRLPGQKDDNDPDTVAKASQLSAILKAHLQKKFDVKPSKNATKKRSGTPGS